ncbi:MAG: glycosyltransferase [Candidatus Bathyarchaeota archaeon]|nr:glycosyltransferase [Candidatus Bathyarchaeota archaeon]
MSAESPPKISIIIAALNSEETISDCLKAIFELNYPQNFLEVIVVDGGSKDKTIQIAEQYPVRVVSTSLNAPAAYNYAMKIACHGVLGFVDADAKVEKEWLNKLVPHLAEQEVAGVSGGIETWNTDNAWARSIGYEMANRYARLKKYTTRIATMNLLMKKSVIEEAGGFDENLPSQYDTDLGFRITRMGYKIVYEPNAKCYHYNRTTVRAFFKQQRQYGKNTLKLYFKHGKLARGDEITDFLMNIQPALMLTMILLFLFGIIEPLRPLWYASALILAFVFAYYVYCAVKLSVKFRDKAAMRLVVLYFVRAFAWLTGAAVTTVSFLLGKRR